MTRKEMLQHVGAVTEKYRVSDSVNGCGDIIIMEQLGSDTARLLNELAEKVDCPIGFDNGESIDVACDYEVVYAIYRRCGVDVAEVIRAVGGLKPDWADAERWARFGGHIPPRVEDALALT